MKEQPLRKYIFLRGESECLRTVGFSVLAKCHTVTMSANKKPEILWRDKESESKSRYRCVWQQQLAAVLTCLCSDTVLQSAAVQMMSSPPAAVSQLKMPHTYTAEGGRGLGEGPHAEGGDREVSTNQS